MLIGARATWLVTASSQLVAQFVQTDKLSETDPDFGGVPVRGGCTLVVGVDGVVRYVISKPLPGAQLNEKAQAAADERVKRQRAFVDELDGKDPSTPYMSALTYRNRMRARMSLRALHEGR